MPTPHEILKQYWGFNTFRPLQEEIIQSILKGNDTLALLPTGGGKSVCFQVPALCNDGICLVVSPLIALMKDQVENLKSKNILSAALYSGMTKRLIDHTLDNCIYGKVKFLYVSPERLQTDLFLERFKKMNVTLIAVDEAHCISQWGYDFRPPYLKIAEIKQFHPTTPIIALTATATPKVVEDIQEKLEFKTNNLKQASFARSNLSYSVLYEDAKLTKLVDILNKVKGSSVVYTRTRRKTKEVADHLNKCKINATYYNAGLSFELRAQRQKDWITGNVRVMVATNAFGMGIDKPDVRTVVHLDLPDSPEAYFQEAGRAGRDGKKAYAVLLFNLSDKLKALQQIEQNTPSVADCKRVYEALGNFFQLAVGSGAEQRYNFNIIKFLKRYNFNSIKTYNSLKILELEEYVILSDSIHSPSKIRIIAQKSALYKFEIEHKEFEPIIKFLLRSYSGILDDFVKINEHQLANKLGTQIQVIETKLKQLHQLKVLEYEPKNSDPFIYYLKPKVAIQNLQLDSNRINWQKKVYKEKLSAIINYASTKTDCRSNILLQYFGETTAKRCGICDFCVGRNELDVSDLLFNKISSEVKEVILGEAHTSEFIVREVKTNNKELVLKIIHWLIDHEVITILESGKLIWNKKQ